MPGNARVIGKRSLGSGPDLEAIYGQLESYLEKVERNILAAALEDCGGNRTRTAEKLGISFRSFRYRLKKLGLGD